MLEAGVEAAWGNIAVVLGDVSMMKDAVSVYVADAVQFILIGNNDISAKIYASFAYYFEQLIASTNPMNKTARLIIDGQGITELQMGDMKTVVEYLRKRIPCSCLDEKYDEVKFVTKMGICANPTCSCKRLERKKMFTCTGCNNFCKEFAEVKATVDSKREN
jgi:hypothetical protein